MTVRDHLSPNQEPRPEGAAIDILLLHYTGMKTAGEALSRLCDPQAKVSAHYFIDEDGTVLRLVPEEARAWHAGLSHWAGEDDINSRSIGIELVNPGHEWGYRPFPEAQMAALETLAAAIVRRHPIAPERVLAHSDVAPARKQDPGEKFDWARLARAGIGLFPFGEAALPSPPSAPHDEAATRALQTKLKHWGYGVEVNGLNDEATAAVVTAFQRHFRAARVDGIADEETRARLDTLLARTGRAG